MIGHYHQAKPSQAKRMFNIKMSKYCFPSNRLMGRRFAAFLFGVFVCLLSADKSIASGDLYFALTHSQRAKFDSCFQVDQTFPGQVEKLLSTGDLLIMEMYPQRNGYLFMLETNSFGPWVEYTPLRCDIRTVEQKLKDKKQEESLSLIRYEKAERQRISAIHAAKKSQRKAQEKKEQLRLTNERQAIEDAHSFHEMKQVNSCVRKANAKSVLKMQSDYPGKSWSAKDDFYKIEESKIFATSVIWLDRNRKKLEETIECQLYAFGEDGEMAMALAQAKSDAIRKQKIISDKAIIAKARQCIDSAVKSATSKGMFKIRDTSIWDIRKNVVVTEDAVMVRINYKKRDREMKAHIYTKSVSCPIEL